MPTIITAHIRKLSSASAASTGGARRRSPPPSRRASARSRDRARATPARSRRRAQRGSPALSPREHARGSTSREDAAGRAPAGQRITPSWFMCSVVEVRRASRRASSWIAGARARSCPAHLREGVLEALRQADLRAVLAAAVRVDDRRAVATRRDPHAHARAARIDVDLTLDRRIDRIEDLRHRAVEDVEVVAPGVVLSPCRILPSASRCAASARSSMMICCSRCPRRSRRATAAASRRETVEAGVVEEALVDPPRGDRLAEAVGGRRAELAGATRSRSCSCRIGAADHPAIGHVSCPDRLPS